MKIYIKKLAECAGMGFLDLNLVRNVKGNKKGSYRYFSSQDRQGSMWACCVNGVGDMVTEDMKNTKVLNAFFTSVFTGKIGIPGPET